MHEAAHVFHNCKRLTAGLPERPRQEWMLEIDFHKRETFAYACEAWSRVAGLTPKRAERLSLVDEYARTFTPDDDRVDLDELVDIIREAARAQNGWKRILARCARRRARRAAPRAPESRVEAGASPRGAP